MTDKIEFTKYAKLQMQERNIDREDVLDTIRFPGQTLSAKRGRKTAQKKLDRYGKKVYSELFLKKKAIQSL